MDWSPDRVLNFGPVTHRRGLQWQRRTNLLWPVRAWRVVAPELQDRPLSILQRTMLRLQLTGTREHVRVGELLGIDPKLAAFVVQELVQMGMMSASGALTDRGRRFIDESELDLDDMRVGWVFQDTWSDRLFPRFVTNLEQADIEADDEGHAWVRSGSKGAPRRDWAFVLRPGNRAVVPPQPLDVIDAARRHHRHARRIQRARLDLDAVPTEAVQQVTFIADEPELYHLLTFAYVPESIEDEEEPWYIADPFGFGASASLREQLERLRGEAQGGLREVIDRMTGEHEARQGDAWLAMQELIRDEARKIIAYRWPRSTHSDDERVRERLVLAFEELGQLDREEAGGREVRDRIDDAYLKLRQSIEQAVQILRDAHAPGDAWRKLYHGEKNWIPANSVPRVISACAAACGFDLPLPSAIRESRPNKVKAACLRADSSSLRPLCVALVLAATDDETHPLRRLALSSPTWLSDMDRIAGAAGAEVHVAQGKRSLEDLRRDADIVIRLCDQLLIALVPGD